MKNIPWYEEKLEKAREVTIEELIEIAEKPREERKEEEWERRERIEREKMMEIRARTEIVWPRSTSETPSSRPLLEEYRVGPWYARIERRPPEWIINMQLKKKATIYIIGGFESPSLRGTYCVNYTVQHGEDKKTKGRTYDSVNEAIEAISEIRKEVEK